MEHPIPGIGKGGWKKLSVLFFALLLLLGLTTYTDYGTHWDQRNNRRFGTAVYNLIMEGEYDPFLDQSHCMIHGPLFELTLAAAEKSAGVEDTRDVTYLRHLLTFMSYWTGILFFYILCNYHFKSPKIALAGSLFIVLTPRIFAHGFYNSVDIPTMTMFTACAYTMLRFLDERDIKWALTHSVSSAVLIGIRNFGAAIPVLTLALTLAYGKSGRKAGVAYAVMTLLLAYMFWPMIWDDPVGGFVSSFASAKDLFYPFTYLYFGETIRDAMPPWHYTPAWMLITTPPLYIILFTAGLGAAARHLTERGWSREKRNTLVFLLWLIIPLASTMIFKVTLYNGWRHHYLVYPAFMMISMEGLRQVKVWADGRRGRSAAVALLITASSLCTAYTMAANHPYEMAYFNFAAGLFGETQDSFPLDYWGLSYRESYERILELDGRDRIRVRTFRWVGEYGVDSLPPEDRKRIDTTTTEEGDYYAFNDIRGYDGGELVCSVDTWWGTMGYVHRKEAAGAHPE
ncbi:MAG: hypothetical protein GF416_08920 [Candidatus Altiarchaeales archaeon]|nr:hypothetical protein [Candidatus Altiarchaeales archaeon]MBD3417239.1 hypothetical protein [Candidatus Altiarchaeales archaeon]